MMFRGGDGENEKIGRSSKPLQDDFYGAEIIRKVKNQSFLEEVEENSQKNTSVNILEYDDGKFTVKLLNDISHIK